MTKNELICKLKFMGFKEDEFFEESYVSNGITIDFDNTNTVAVITDILKYLEYKDVINYIITIDK